MTADPTESFATPRAAAGVLFFDQEGDVLLVAPSYKDYRDIPGGYIERGETPKQAAVREVQEELGITPTIGRLLIADWAPTETEGDKVLFVFDGGTLAPEQLNEIHLDPAELNAYEFHPVANIHELTIARLARRIVQAHEARADGSTRYLEHGHPTS
ncbi:NUDIX domain-containing protein [Actinomadura rupiterrae]|uniref:NUDIX domain-containing protein n=1 Tax=Actinomadura rupiterrae TaxID=559627 RepID=UPI0020A3849C|nr:NUDIX hydrolase [Actinomadura rupiterrae]MCP2343431.1 8-oxo-dGTP pyrophosphatase MutT (NUDIX family) [Actinomadura rupiterrae]